MTQKENGILLRVEKKVDQIDIKFDRVMEKYIIPHDEFIKNYKQEKKDKKEDKKFSKGNLIAISLSVFNVLVLVGIAIFK